MGDEMHSRLIQLSRGAVGLVLVVQMAALSQRVRAADTEKPYKVVDGKVDIHVYNGYRRYTESCMRCHGPDGAGSSYAPALTDSLTHLTYDQFAETVINGRQNVSSSATNVMPAFGATEDVVNYIDDIYAYLKARSDGAIGRGRPQRMDSNG
jgi:methanol metabolism-related c-type cytochrome